MIKNIIHKLLLRHHFWRYATFSELAELYTSNMLRALACNLFSIFIPIYLLKNGYSVTSISLYYCFYFVVRIFGDVLAGYAVARIGPKHTWFLSHLSNIANLFCLLLLPTHPWLFLISAATNALGTSFQLVPLHVDFSKIKHVEHNGKEQSFFTILEKTGAAIGPVIGGFIAASYGAGYAIAGSIAVYGLSLAPLLLSPEPVVTHQHIRFRGFPYKKVWRDIAAHVAQGVDTTVTAGMWPLFLVIVIFKDSQYQSVGAITTISIIIAIAATYVFGIVIDKKHSLRFLRISVVIDSLLYVGRALSGSFGAAIATNIANEAAYTGVTMAFNKGMYDAVDDLPGYRIVYFIILEVMSEVGKLLIWALLALLAYNIPDKSALQICFMVTCGVTLFIMVERFRALRPGFFERLL